METTTDKVRGEEVLAMTPEEVGFDEVIFTQSTMGDARLARMVVDAFLASSPKHIEDFRTATAEQRWLDAKRAAHTMKGSALTLGLNAFAGVCLSLENLVSTEQLPEAERVEELEQSLKLASDFLRARFVL